MLTEDYAVRLESFEGPLDLLLLLIRRAEVDISEISIASITDQYLRHLEGLHRIDVEPAGEFLVTAATLVEIKSRILTPPSEDEGGESLAQALAEAEGGNPAAELIRALLAYKRYREAAESLQRRRSSWQRRFPLAGLATPPPPAGDAETEPPLDLEDIGLFDLVQAYARIAETVVFDRMGQHAIVDDDTPIELHAADVLDRLRAAGEGDAPRVLPMRSLFSGRARAEVIGLFLAVLELVRQRIVRVRASQDPAAVSLELAEEADAASPPGGPSTIA